MTKLIIIILLITTCLGLIGCFHILTMHPDQSLDIEDLFSFGCNVVVGLLCVTAAALIVRSMSQIQFSVQIPLSFFFYAWRNSIYNGAARRFNALFSSLKTETSF